MWVIADLTAPERLLSQEYLAGRLVDLRAGARPSPPHPQRNDNADEAGNCNNDRYLRDTEKHLRPGGPFIVNSRQQLIRMVHSGGCQRYRRNSRRADEQTREHTPPAPAGRQATVRKDQKREEDQSERRPPQPLAQPGEQDPTGPACRQYCRRRDDPNRDHHPTNDVTRHAVQDECAHRQERQRDWQIKCNQYQWHGVVVDELTGGDRNKKGHCAHGSDPTSRPLGA